MHKCSIQYIRQRRAASRNGLALPVEVSPCCRLQLLTAPCYGPPQFDVTFPKVPCAWLSLDAMDISGELHLDLVVETCRVPSQGGVPQADAQRGSSGWVLMWSWWPCLWDSCA